MATSITRVVEFAWQHTREEVHLRAAFHLKHANRVGHAKHIIGFRILLRDRCDRERFAIMFLQQDQSFCGCS